MKTVCILLQNHYDIDIRVRRKAEALVAAGYEVDVIALRTSGSSASPYQLNGVNVHTIALGKHRGSLFRYFIEYSHFFAVSAWKLSNLMRTRRYAIVDVNNLPDFLVFAGFWARFRGAKIVFDMHEITPEFYISKYGIKENSATVRLLKFIERCSIRYSDHVITINDSIQRLLLGRGMSAENSTIVMNSVDEALFSPERRRPVARGLPAEKPPFVMMYHGTLTKIYGLDIAIEAFRLASDRMPGAEFWILGAGPEKDLLARQAAGSGLSAKVRLVGSVLPDDIPQWLERCDIGVLPTRRDIFLDLSFSNKLSEYIIMSKPVICSRLRAIQHYFSESAIAYFQPQDIGALSEQMVRLYREPELRPRLARAAAEEYRPIRWEVMRDRYLALTAGLLSEPPVGANSKRPAALARQIERN